MEIPGITAVHAIISDNCRKGRTDDGAFEEAVRRMKTEYDAIMKGWPIGKGTTIHMALTVERPESLTDSVPPVAAIEYQCAGLEGCKVLEAALSEMFVHDKNCPAFHRPVSATPQEGEE